MKTNIPLSDVELTGERRLAADTDIWIGWSGVVCHGKSDDSVAIVRLKAESKKPLISDASEQPEPKFKVGDMANFDGKPFRILSLEFCHETLGWFYAPDTTDKTYARWYVESELSTPEPKPARKLICQHEKFIASEPETMPIEIVAEEHRAMWACLVAKYIKWYYSDDGHEHAAAYGIKAALENMADYLETNK